MKKADITCVVTCREWVSTSFACEWWWRQPTVSSTNTIKYRLPLRSLCKVRLTSRVTSWVTFSPGETSDCILEMWASNFSLAWFELFSGVFLRPPKHEWWDSISLMSRPFPLKSFETYRPHLTLYSMTASAWCNSLYIETNLCWSLLVKGNQFN